MRSYEGSGHATRATSPGINAVVFLGFVLAGAGYIILAKLGGIDQVYVTFVPVGAMLAYALLITLARGLRLRDDQSGDNLYYMGFLFTLTSLGVSLYQFTVAGAAEEIVQNFGIAVGSTIAGIGLRVVFNQMRRDPVEVERTMRLELAEAARRVRRELDASVVEFGYFRRCAQQSAADSLAQSAAAVERLSATVATALAAGNERLSAEVEKLSARVSQITDAVAAAASGLDRPERSMAVEVAPIADILTKAIEQMTAQSAAQARAVNDAITRSSAAPEWTADLIATLRGEIDQTTATNRAALEAAVAMIKATADVLNEIKASSRDYVDALALMLERTDETMRAFRKTLMQSSAETAAQTERVAALLPVLEAKTQALAGVAGDMARPPEVLHAEQRRAVG